MRYAPWPFPSDPKDDSGLVRMERSARELDQRGATDFVPAWDGLEARG